MARMARLVVPGYPHHVVQRGNHKERVFFSDRDRHIFLALLGEYKEKAGLSIWAYCLMPNHVHLVVVPGNKNSLAKGLAEVHRHYARRINMRNEWKGFLWQGRYYSCPLDERHVLEAIRYVELNPVRAGLAQTAAEYVWSSARAHLFGDEDPVLSPHKDYLGIKDWSEFLGEDVSEADISALRDHSRTGRPLGDDAFIKKLEDLTGKKLARGKPGPKPKARVSLPSQGRDRVLFGLDELG
jgi:REP-associated tyrosine transposase